MRIVGLRSQTERISACCVEKLGFYSFTCKYTQCTFDFFSWQILKPRAWILKGVECFVNNEFFVHLQRKELETQIVHKILRLNIGSKLQWRGGFEANLQSRFQLPINPYVFFWTPPPLAKQVTVSCYDNSKSMAWEGQAWPKKRNLIILSVKCRRAWKDLNMVHVHLWLDVHPAFYTRTSLKPQAYIFQFLG